MERRNFVAMLGIAAALMPQSALAGSMRDTKDNANGGVAPPAGQLAGTWSFVSSVNTRKDGVLIDRWGVNPKGILIFDPSGHFAQIICGSESRLFGAKTYCAFGSYAVDGGKSISMQFEGCSIPKLIGTTQDRQIVHVTPDELKYINPNTATGTSAEVVWKRLV